MDRSTGIPLLRSEPHLDAFQTARLFGRAFFVKVRRSQGADDATIVGELGQTTNGDLIRSVYGDPKDLHGGALFDWLPEDKGPAWDLLAAQPVKSDTEAIRARCRNHRSSCGVMRGSITAKSEEGSSFEESKMFNNH
jgi:hypothetical protein